MLPDSFYDCMLVFLAILLLLISNIILETVSIINDTAQICAIFCETGVVSSKWSMAHIRFRSFAYATTYSHS